MRTQPSQTRYSSEVGGRVRKAVDRHMARKVNQLLKLRDQLDSNSYIGK